MWKRRLVDANLPRMSVAPGREMGYFSRWQVAQPGALSMLGKVLPGSMKGKVRLAGHAGRGGAARRRCRFVGGGRPSAGDGAYQAADACAVESSPGRRV